MTLAALLHDARPVMVAPMAGGPSTPELVTAAAQAGAFAQLAGGYKSAEALASQIDEVRARGTERFGVNLFVPNLHRIADADYEAYAERIRDELGGGPVAAKREDDDAWDAKVALLLEARVPLVSFTFGLPDPAVLAAFADAGITTMQTVTSVDEARDAAASGVDSLVVQGSAAGGHSGIWAQDALPADMPLLTLVAEVRAVTTLPIVAAGGIARREHVRALCRNEPPPLGGFPALKRSHHDDLIRFRDRMDLLDMRPRLWVAYEREAYGSHYGDGARLTFDTELRVQPPDDDDPFVPDDACWQSVALDGPQAIVEMKFNGAFPFWMQRIVHGLQLKRVSCSKYVQGVEQTGDVPWNRVEWGGAWTVY